MLVFLEQTTKFSVLEEARRGLTPYMGYIGMCGLKGRGFSAVLLINRLSILAILVLTRVWVLYSSLGYVV